MKEFARPGDVVLVKASRAMRLERITEALRARTTSPAIDMLFYLSQKRSALAKHTPFEAQVCLPAAFQLHHISQRGGGSDGAVVKLVARTAHDPLAQGIEVRPELHGPGGGNRRHFSRACEQTRHADHGRPDDCAGAGRDNTAVGAMEHADSIDTADGGGAVRPGFPG